jgi:hypothetical protein
MESSRRSAKDRTRVTWDVIMKESKAQRTLRLAADEAAAREPSVYGQSVLKRLSEAVHRPKPAG